MERRLAAGEADALARDAADPLSGYRDRFLLPVGPDGAPVIYLAGQSLGLQPRTARAAIEIELDAWARRGVDAWFDPARPWFTLTDRLRDPMARLVGARPSEVAILNALTVNIHLLLASFFRPDGRRRRILADGPLFPSDRHALTSHLLQRGLDPARDLLSSSAREGSSMVPTADLEAAIARARRRTRAGLARRRQLRDGPGARDRAPDSRRRAGRCRSSAGTWRTRSAMSSSRCTTGMSTSPRGAPTST